MSGRSLREGKKRLEFPSKILITLTRRGEKYTVLGDADKVLQLYRREIKPSKVLVSNEVFVDIQKGKKAPMGDLRDIVVAKRMKGAADPSTNRDQVRAKVKKMDPRVVSKEAAEYIAKVGNIKLPKKVRDRLIKEKKEKILNYIQKYAINPGTQSPYPPKKVETVFNEMTARMEIDPLTEAEKQIPRIVEVLSDKLPLKLEILTILVNIPARYTGKAYSAVKQMGEMKDTDWQNDGSLRAKVRIPGGQYLNLKRRLNDLTRGRATSEIVGRESF